MIDATATCKSSAGLLGNLEGNRSGITTQVSLSRVTVDQSGSRFSGRFVTIVYLAAPTQGHEFDQYGEALAAHPLARSPLNGGAAARMKSMKARSGAGTRRRPE